MPSLPSSVKSCGLARSSNVTSQLFPGKSGGVLLKGYQIRLFNTDKAYFGCRYLHSSIEAVSLAAKALTVNGTKRSYGNIEDAAIGWVVADTFDRMDSVTGPENTIAGMDCRHRDHGLDDMRVLLFIDQRLRSWARPCHVTEHRNRISICL